MSFVTVSTVLNVLCVVGVLIQLVQLEYNSFSVFCQQKPTMLTSSDFSISKYFVP